MATWEDGPEYAPLARPDQFSGPDVAPLDVAPPPVQPAALASRDRPRFDQPDAPLAPLATLVPADEDRRDPSLPFDVVSSTLTSDSAWGAAHWSGQQNPTGPLTSSYPAHVGQPGAPGPPTPAAWDSQAEPSWLASQAPPSANTSMGPSPYGVPATHPSPGQLPPPGFPAGPQHAGGFPAGPQHAGGFPAPGTPQWFGPRPAVPTLVPAPVDAKRVSEIATPGVLIALVVGGLIYLLAPVTLVLALLLSRRIPVAQPQIRRAFWAAVGSMTFFAVVGALTNSTTFSEWWRFVGLWALLISWVMVAVVLVLVWRALRTQAWQPPGYRPPWG